MAENKKSFVLYADQIGIFTGLDDDEAGRLIKHIFEYVNDKNPEPTDKLTRIAFEPIKQQLKRDLVKWENFKVKQSENGKLGGRPKKTEPLNENPKNPSLISETQKSLNVTVNDNVNVTVIDIWKNSYEYLKQDGVWYEQEVVMKFKIPAQDLNNRLEQYWLSLQKSNFKGELKQIRAGAIKWLKTWSDRDSKPTGGKQEVITKKYERL